jgi:endoglucanase
LAGAEFKSQRIPGKLNKDYHYPRERDIKYFLDRGFTAFRLPFRWERLQRNLGWEFEARELALLDATVAYITVPKSGARLRKRLLRRSAPRGPGI